MPSHGAIMHLLMQATIEPTIKSPLQQTKSQWAGGTAGN